MSPGFLNCGNSGDDVQAARLRSSRRARHISRSKKRDESVCDISRDAGGS